MDSLEHEEHQSPKPNLKYRILTFVLLQSISMPMTQEESGKTLLVIGVILCLVGGLLWGLGDRLKWLGHLPGDFSYEKQNFKFYFPFTTILILNGLVWLILKIKDWFSK